MEMSMSRREFIKASAATAAMLAAGIPAQAMAAQGDGGISFGRAQCRFCGTGCTVLVGVRNGRVVAVKGDADSPINFGRLCMKGYSLPHIMYGGGGKQRLTKPMVRQADGSFKEVSWDEALELIADKFAKYIEEYGPDSVAWYGSGQNTTQEAFAANKLFKGIIGTANVEGNPRLCMASAVGGYLNTFGLDEPAGAYDDLDDADTFFIIGANMAEQHPMLFRRVIDRKSAYPDRVKVIVADPRTTPTARYADLHLKFKPGTDMYLLNAIAYAIIEEELVDDEHLKYCSFAKGLGKGEALDFEAFKEFLKDYAPEKVADITGVSAEDIRLAAKWFGRKGYSALSMWTMGLNQRTQGVELNCQVHNLHLLTGKIGKPGCDSLSLTGQPNACGGTREQGGLTHILPAHRKVANEQDRKEVAEVWGVPVEQMPTKPTGPAVNMFMRLEKGDIKAIWINTTNPAQSLPNSDRYTEAMRKAFTVVSDIYPTVTTEVASVILPSAMWVEKEGVMGQTDRRSQFTPKLVEPPGEAKPDFWQIKEVARRIAEKLGRKTRYKIIDPLTGEIKGEKEVYGLGFETEEEAWNEYRLLTKGRDVDLWGATYGKLKAHAGGVQWPCPSTEFDNRGSNKRYISREYAIKVFGKDKRRYITGYVTLYDQHMEEEGYSGPINYYGKKGKAVVRAFTPTLDYEMPDDTYPFVLNTGRVIEHWHTGTMTMRVRLLRELNPAAYVEVHPSDAEKLGVKSGDKLQLISPRGSITLSVWVTERAQPGMVFVPWFDETKLINDLTIDVPESWSKAAEPDYKVCKIRVAKAT
ncbi:molybdopterin oxidoreductase family protein [Candidatus Pyrohabitans sp.]